MLFSLWNCDKSSNGLPFRNPSIWRFPAPIRTISPQTSLRELDVAEAYYLKLLGFPELRRPDGRQVKLKVRKHLALLIYLVVDGREVYYRDELAELLWPGVPEENSRHSLSMAFSVLRGLFGSDCIGGNHAEVRFQAPPLATDLDQLEGGEVLGTEVVPPLEVDAFVRDFVIEDAPAFQHWRDRRNAQLLPMLQAAVMVLTDQARRSADMPRMLALADRLLALDPLSEEGVRARMEAFAMQGDRVGALRVYEAWKSQLFEELGAVPSDILQAMAARLRRPSAEPAAAVAAPALCTESRFVGRAEEYRALFEAWESTTQFNTRHVLITGESGIGKSTLALRFASAAALEGAAVARVQCFELEQRIAFGMIGALITSLLDRPSASGTTPESLAEIARVVPRVRERFPHLPTPRASEGEAARLRFAEATFALLDAIMEDQPLVLIVDDYPRSDEASLSVLHMLLRRMTNERLMVVLAGRPPEPDEPAQAGRIRKAVSSLPMQRVDLVPLGDGDSEEMLAGLLSNFRSKPASPERRAIVRTAGGNPMAMELLIHDWKKHGSAALAVLLPAMGDAPGSALEAIGYDRLIDRIVPNLGSRAKVALYLAAILGPSLNDFDSFEIVDLTPTQALIALTELIDNRVLRSIGGKIEFVNELIRARLYLRIPGAVRTRLHSAVANRLISIFGQGKGKAGLELAWHCMRSGRRDDAAPYLITGAREAVTHGAPDEASRALMTGLGQLRGPVRVEASVLLAETFHEMSQWNDALECLQALRKVEKQQGKLAALAEVLELESRRQLQQIDEDKIASFVEDLIGRTRNGNCIHSRVRAGLSAVQGAASFRNYELLAEAAVAIDEIPMRKLDRRELARVLLGKALANYHLRRSKNGESEVSEAFRILSEANTTDSTFVSIQLGQGVLACSRGRYEEGVEPIHRAYLGAIRLDNINLITQSANNLTLCHYRSGAVEEHLRWAQIGRQAALAMPPGSYERINSNFHCALAFLARKEKLKAAEALRELQTQRKQAEIDWVRHAGFAHEADIAWITDQHSTALELVAEWFEDANGNYCHGFEGRAARWMTVSATTPLEQHHAAETIMKRWYPRLNQLDVLDQAEVCCSLAHLGRFRQPVPVESAGRARELLATLHSVCAQQLRGLGLLIPN